MAVKERMNEKYNLRSRLPKRTRNVVDPIVFTLGLFVVWEVGVRVYDINLITLPAPSAILDTLIGTWSIIAGEAVTTTQYILIALVVGCLFGVLSGFVLHYSKTLYRVAFPVLVIAFVIPKIALAPLLLLYFGTTSAYFILLPVLFVYFPVLENTLTGLRGVDRELMELSELYHPTGWFKFRHVQVPYSLPYIGAGVKIGVTQATIGVIIAEIIAPRWGLGSLLMIAETYNRTSLIFAGIVVIGLIGVVIYKVVERLESRVIFWRETEGGVA